MSPALASPTRPLVGRTVELAALRARVVDTPTASATLLGGDAGVGKTRLLTELAQAAETAGATVLVGHCLDLGDSSAPYLPVSELLARGAREEERVATVLRRHPDVGPLLPASLRTAADTGRRERRADVHRPAGLRARPRRGGDRLAGPHRGGSGMPRLEALLGRPLSLRTECS